MRGVKSHAMVLAASNEDHTQVIVAHIYNFQMSSNKKNQNFRKVFATFGACLRPHVPASSVMPGDVCECCEDNKPLKIPRCIHL